MSRLAMLASNEHFTTCNCCGFVYLPMTKRAADNCPKCKPIEQQMKYVDPDIAYLNNEAQEIEEVNTDYLNDNLPAMRYI